MSSGTETSVTAQNVTWRKQRADAYEGNVRLNSDWSSWSLISAAVVDWSGDSCSAGAEPHWRRSCGAQQGSEGRI